MKPQKVMIRKAGLKDVPLIVKMWKEFVKDHERIVLSNNPKQKTYLSRRPGAAKMFGKYISKQIRSTNAVVHIADVKGKPAGYNLTFTKKNIPIFTVGKLGYLSDLFVRDKYRGMGISSMLKDEALRWLKKKGVAHASIMVNPNNPHAHKIYKRWGFMEYHVEMRKKL
jgi:GNAT superfamily N-acetyltransferase